MSESEQSETSRAEASIRDESTTSTTEESTEEGSTTEESTAERSTRPRYRTDLIAARFYSCAERYEDVLTVICRTHLNEMMVDELAERLLLIDELESSLLPSIIDHIDSISLSLDLKDPSNQYSNPDLELTSELAIGIDKILDKTRLYVHSISANFVGDSEDDGSFKGCKKFRRRRLQVKIGECIKVDIVNLFYTYDRYIKTYNRLTTSELEEAEHQAKKADLREKIIRDSDLCRRSIVETIRWSQKSDLAILQESWLVEKESVIHALECLTPYTKPDIINLGEPRPYSISHSSEDYRGERNRPGEDVIELARLSIPIVKLTRIFMNKLIRTNRVEGLFSLDPEIDSINLKRISLGPKQIGHLLDNLTRMFSPHPRLSGGLDDQGKAFAHNLMRRLLKSLDSTLLLLSFYLVPTSTLATTVDSEIVPSLKNHLRIWFLDFGNLCQKAIDRFIDRLFSSSPHHIRIK
ncbi:hypothetical protein MJO28_003692 [Puccinia striiformis f. sp. tritici]|uniref:Uncharacterized protein n=2 Tax=Puccinia striiformis TaxID=27350 RepID=A0A2S4UL71_9BASI|nr:hypothetical protein MJO29_016728 [Puccinia striiformis f. sp. tritici]KAI7956597.1 hypothetical protein MJO28_003692 [Puccinia striiformis f. sp. tritici]POV97874.1 hypothetical protein PSTT_14787 [Puccinia striiformis]